MPKITGSPTEYLDWIRDQADQPIRDEALNELLMFVYHLETIERRYEQHMPLTIAMREVVR